MKIRKRNGLVRRCIYVRYKVQIFIFFYVMIMSYDNKYSSLVLLSKNFGAILQSFQEKETEHIVLRFIVENHIQFEILKFYCVRYSTGTGTIELTQLLYSPNKIQTFTQVVINIFIICVSKFLAFSLSLTKQKESSSFMANQCGKGNMIQLVQLYFPTLKKNS